MLTREITTCNNSFEHTQKSSPWRRCSKCRNM